VRCAPAVAFLVLLPQLYFPPPRVVPAPQSPPALRLIPPCPSRRYLDVPPAPQRLAHQQLVADTLPFVLVIDLGRAAPSGPPRRPHLPAQLLARLVEADHRVPGGVGQHVGLDHVLHPPAELAILL